MPHSAAHMQRRRQDESFFTMLPNLLSDCAGDLWDAGSRFLDNPSHPRRAMFEAPPPERGIMMREEPMGAGASSWHSYPGNHSVRAEAMSVSSPTHHPASIELSQADITGMARPENPIVMNSTLHSSPTYRPGQSPGHGHHY